MTTDIESSPQLPSPQPPSPSGHPPAYALEGDGAEPWPRQSKTDVARKIAQRIADHFKA